MARVTFTVHSHSSIDADAVWRALVDWQGHGDWVPATTVRVIEGDGGVGTVFVARTGVGPLAFDDHMVVTAKDDEARTATVRKTGPLLLGEAGFTVVSTPTGSLLSWFEDVTIPRVPSFLGPIAVLPTKASFMVALANLRRQLTRQDPSAVHGSAPEPE